MNSGAVIDQLYPGRTCEPTCNLTQGTPIVVSFGSVAAGIDFVLRRPTFADVSTTHWAWKFVEAVSAAGVTSGCGTSPLRFCPNDGVTRGQATLFLLRGKEGTSYLPPPATGLFADVPKTEPLAPWVEEVYRRGITAGCATNPLRFCPGAPLTRGQVAPFLLLTKEGSGYRPPVCGTPIFADVPASSPLCAFIEELVRRGIASGCSTSPALFCPGQALTRAQMAVFLVTGFALPLP